MKAYCEIHNSEMKFIPAGTSRKTGKRYAAFYACTNYNCKETAPATDAIEDELGIDGEVSSVDRVKKFEKEIEQGDYTEEPANTVDDSPMSKAEWKEKDRQIARLTLAKSYIQAGISFDAAVENGDLKEWTEWILTGEI